jgi:hypothetical protein
MDTSAQLETKVKKLTEGEYFVEDVNGGLLAKTWREDIANQLSYALNGKDIDLLNGKAGEFLNAQIAELAALRAENARLREALEAYVTGEELRERPDGLTSKDEAHNARLLQARTALRGEQ